MSQFLVPSSCLLKNYVGQVLILDRSVFTPFKTGCVYGHCGNQCCASGAWVTQERKDIIDSHISKIKEYLTDSVLERFSDKPLITPRSNEGDSAYNHIETYETKTYKGRCVFMTEKGSDNGMSGCAIHKYALDNGLEPSELKPIGCLTYPLGFSTPNYHRNGVVNDKFDVKIVRRRWNIPCLKDKSTDAPLMIEVKAEDLRWVLGWTKEENDRLINYYFEYFNIKNDVNRDLNIWSTCNGSLNHINKLKEQGYNLSL